jgi:hypothetical protein
LHLAVIMEKVHQGQELEDDAALLVQTDVVGPITLCVPVHRMQSPAKG